VTKRGEVGGGGGGGGFLEFNFSKSNPYKLRQCSSQSELVGDVEGGHNCKLIIMEKKSLITSRGVAEDREGTIWGEKGEGEGKVSVIGFPRKGDQVKGYAERRAFKKK